MRKQTVDNVAVFLAELIGTALLVFLGCMGCLPNHGLGHFNLCFNFGLVVMVIIQIFGCVSGGHINPAVTVAAVVYKLVSVPMAFVYFTGQLLGGILGYGALKFVTPASFYGASDEGFCMTIPQKDVTVPQAIFIEFMITAVLIFVCCGVWDPRNAKHMDSVPIKFGLTIACLAAVGGPYTGASMNPARSLGPALWNGDFANHWIYWIAPLSAGLIISVLYKFIFRREVAESEDKIVEGIPLTFTKA